MTNERRMEIVRETTIVARAIRRRERELQDENRLADAVQLLELRRGAIRTANRIARVVRV